MERDKEPLGTTIATRALAAAMLIGGIVLAGAVVEVALGQQQWFWESPAHSSPTSTVTPTSRPSEPTGMPALIDDPSQPDWMIQGEWYCWNSGPLLPHHLGHHVPNDHLCTWGELRSSGFAYTP